MALTSGEFAALARGQMKKKLSTTKPGIRKTIVSSRQKGYKKIEEKNEGYNRSAQKKKIKPRKGSYPLTYPEAIGFNY